MNHFLYAYHGNKRREYKFIEPYINLDGINNIIEPFCGSSAISFNLWLKHPNKNYYLNDNDNLLCKVYELIKTEDPETIKNNINELLGKPKEDYKNIVEVFKNKKKISCTEEEKKNIMDNIYNFIIYKLCLVKGKIFDSTKRKAFKFNKVQLQFINFIKSDNVHILNNNWFELFNIHKNNNDTLFIFDPPYLMSYNGFYDLTGQLQYTNIYEYVANNNINTFNAKIIFILEKTWITDLLFKNNIKGQYNKKYEISKKNTIHYIASNY